MKKNIRLRAYITIFFAFFISSLTMVQASRLPTEGRNHYPNVFNYTANHSKTPVDNRLNREELTDRFFLKTMPSDLVILQLTTGNPLLLAVLWDHHDKTYKRYLLCRRDRTIYQSGAELGYHAVETEYAHIIPALLQWMQAGDCRNIKFLLTNVPICPHCHKLLKICFNKDYALQVRKKGCNGDLFPLPLPLAAQDFLRKFIIPKCSSYLEFMTSFFPELMSCHTEKEPLLTPRNKQLENKNNQLKNRITRLQRELNYKNSELNRVNDAYGVLKQKFNDAILECNELKSNVAVLRNTLRHKKNSTLSHKNGSHKLTVVSCATDIEKLPTSWEQNKNTCSHTKLEPAFKKEWDMHNPAFFNEMMKNNKCKKDLYQAMTTDGWLQEYLFNLPEYMHRIKFISLKQDQSKLHIAINANNIVSPTKVILDSYRPNSITIDPNEGNTPWTINGKELASNANQDLAHIAQTLLTIIQVKYIYQHMVTMNDSQETKYTINYASPQFVTLQPIRLMMTSNAQYRTLYNLKDFVRSSIIHTNSYIKQHIDTEIGRQTLEQRTYHIADETHPTEMLDNIMQNSQPFFLSCKHVLEHIFSIMHVLEQLGMKQFPNY